MGVSFPSQPPAPSKPTGSFANLLRKQINHYGTEHNNTHTSNLHHTHNLRESMAQQQPNSSSLSFSNLSFRIHSILRMPRYSKRSCTFVAARDMTDDLSEEESRICQEQHQQQQQQQQEEDRQHTNNRTVNFGKVAVMEFDKEKAPCQTIQHDRWASTRPEKNKSYTRPNIYNLRGSLVLFGRRDTSSRPIQPKRRESTEMNNHNNSTSIKKQAAASLSLSNHHQTSWTARLFPNLPRRRSSVEECTVAQPNNKRNLPMRLPQRRSSVEPHDNTQQQSQEEFHDEQHPSHETKKRSSFLALAFAPFRRRRSSVMREAGAAMPMPNLPQRRSSLRDDQKNKQ